MCELLHTASANQTCDSTILLWEQAPLGLNAQRPPITGVPGAQIGGPFSGGNPPSHSGLGRAAARLDSEQFKCVQKNSGLPQGPARPLGSRLSVRQETPRLLGSHSWEEGQGPT